MVLHTLTPARQHSSPSTSPVFPPVLRPCMPTLSSARHLPVCPPVSFCCPMPACLLAYLLHAPLIPPPIACRPGCPSVCARCHLIRTPGSAHARPASCPHIYPLALSVRSAVHLRQTNLTPLSHSARSHCVIKHELKEKGGASANVGDADDKPFPYKELAKTRGLEVPGKRFLKKKVIPLLLNASNPALPCTQIAKRI